MKLSLLDEQLLRFLTGLVGIIAGGLLACACLLAVDASVAPSSPKILQVLAFASVAAIIWKLVKPPTSTIGVPLFILGGFLFLLALTPDTEDESAKNERTKEIAFGVYSALITTSGAGLIVWSVVRPGKRKSISLNLNHPKHQTRN